MADALTYQEMLRTLGTVLDIAGAETARIEVSGAGAQLAAPPGAAPVAWDVAALATESAAQRNWRLRPRPHNGPLARLFSERLRVLGARLDAQGGGPYVVAVGPDGVHAQGPNGFDCTFRPEQLRYGRA